MKYFLFALLFLSFVACSKSDKYAYLSIQSDTDYTKVELSLFDSVFVAFDEAQLNEKGIWQFRADSVPFGIYQLSVDGAPLLRFIIDDYNSELLRISHANGMASFAVRNNQELLGLWRLEQHTSRLKATLDSLALSFPDSMPPKLFMAHRDTVISLIDTIKSAYKNNLKHVLRVSRSPLLKMCVLSQKVGFYSPFSPIEDSKDFVTVSQLLEKDYQSYGPAVRFCARVDSLNKYLNYVGVCKVGATLPTIAIPAESGELISTTRFVDKDLLVIVWSSTDSLCRTQNRQVLSSTIDARRKGLEVFMVSLDKDTAQWRKAIFDDKLPFIHSCDAKGLQSPVWRWLGVDELPLFLVKNKVGMITERSHDLNTALKALNL